MIYRDKIVNFNKSKCEDIHKNKYYFPAFSFSGLNIFCQFRGRLYGGLKSDVFRNPWGVLVLFVAIPMYFRPEKTNMTKKWLLPRLGLPTRQNPRWPPFYRKIEKIAIKYVLIDLE